ncbi:uncharacterized protein SAPINGB_P002647 [Magnusiomyces paraingens]|uniref:Uncharacterized protein n=1 Tax=Magnusiomyces paraingens TaxID=2606893 RepID=A0A5E8BEZ9_9ASCO|nr:uncharacterized protein SAPINGB_P002647 [Saprochaete ingens]VVT50193.1 unnamed protein product [Saprochaete ingens]
MCNLILKIYGCGHRENTGEFELCHFAQRVGTVCVGVTGVSLRKPRTCCEQCYDPDLGPNVDSPAIQVLSSVYNHGKSPETQKGLSWSEFFGESGPGSTVTDSGLSSGNVSESQGEKKKRTGIFGRPGTADLLREMNESPSSISVSASCRSSQTS